ncbi:MAG: tetraacyldisaccharide 4'-kinase [Candidatus Binatus sp.]|uniref:tetraacyldisaccharide 4'-kinase n=1 Tax=Candidatus Binatus sp. TaxID=2811406 RepID=UPI0027163803|nr:tetraacyldisaccharide 4'-kinase [Candidatus Binatus sp.]MDO8432002.1 tetraacyldisaccharide 4'-kinase [Candidatus Binatus sp.]
MRGSEPTAGRPRIERLWQSHLSLADVARWIPLAGASGIFRLGVSARRLYWQMMKRAAGVKTISVGNLTVGGNGKTPFTIFLASRLQSRGLKVGIVSRGYSRRRGGAAATLIADRGELLVTAEEAGDEPAMMAKSFSGPIAVARRRLDGIELLMRRGPLDAVILDDAFQHLRLERDVDLVLINSARGLGNGWMLPAGPMREPLGAIDRADAIVLIDAGGGESALSKSQMERIRALTVLHATIRARALVAIEHGAWREIPIALVGARVLAVSGLADPSGFYAMLRALEADLIGVLEYPDHHAYSASDWRAIVNALGEGDIVVTTEKDLVKLERFPFTRNSLYALRLEIEMAPAEAAALDELIVGRELQTSAAQS